MSAHSLQYLLFVEPNVSFFLFPPNFDVPCIYCQLSLLILMLAEHFSCTYCVSPLTHTVLSAASFHLPARSSTLSFTTGAASAETRTKSLPSSHPQTFIFIGVMGSRWFSNLFWHASPEEAKKVLVHPLTSLISCYNNTRGNYTTGSKLNCTEKGSSPVYFHFIH